MRLTIQYGRVMLEINCDQKKSAKPPKRAMHRTDGDLMENTTDTSRKQADKRNSPLTDGNEGDGGENAC